MTTKCTCTKDGFNDAGVDTYGCPLHSTPTVEEIVEDAVYNLVQELETTDCQDSDGIFRQDAYDVIRAHLTTYGNQRYEEGVKAERERVREWAKEKKEKLTMKWDNDKAKSTVYDSILYGWDGFLDDNK